jgi:hypothetical protein
MQKKKLNAKGFTLIASLLILVLLSGVAIGLMYMTNTEVRVGGNNLENNLAYYGAEAGMEKMTSDLGNLFNNSAPNLGAINALQAFPPTVPNIAYSSYQILPLLDVNGNMVTRQQVVSSGSNQGLHASIIPITLVVTAQRPSGAQIKMQRTIEVALIPVFQFGVFSDGDLDYFAGPYFNFGGRIHTNKNLFFAANSGPLELGDKVTASGEIIRSNLENGLATSPSSYGGGVYIPTTSGGCVVGNTAPASSTCRNLALSEGSLQGMPGSGTTNPGWTSPTNIVTAYNGFLINGANILKLPFVQGGTGPIEIIRKATPGDTTAVSSSREYTKAQIRILLADTPALLHPGPADGQDVLLTNETASLYRDGVPVAGTPAGHSFFAYANTVCDAAHARFCEPADQKGAYKNPSDATQDFTGQQQWPLIGGWLRVEIRKTDGTYVGVTTDWLQQGFARGQSPPSALGANAYHPNAILILQQIASRLSTAPPAIHTLGCGNLSDGSGRAETCPNIAPTAANFAADTSRFAWFPINLYDTREGEIRDTASAGDSCAPNGVMNVVELDVGNLKRWLAGNIGVQGTQTDNMSQNGYLLFFSDRRGQVPGNVNGQYGFEDTINSANSAGTPDGVLDPLNFENISPEDVNGNGALERYGATNVGQGFTTAFAPSFNPYANRLSCSTVGLKNWVSGARHGLKLVDGRLGNLPTRPDGTGGFTVVSENPVYVLGDYNANGAFIDPDAAAAVIADSVTLLSNAWDDRESLYYPTNLGQRNRTETYYRMAIAGGKTIPFAHPNWASADFVTDGGMHNFLRYLEGGGTPVHYEGSMVSLYYSQYSTGAFKCCSTVYGAPTRNYAFDNNFLDPTKLPPGTPELQDVNNLSYSQDFTPQ